MYLSISEMFLSFGGAYVYDNFQHFDVLLTVHLSIFISVIKQLDAQNVLFYNKFISCLYTF